MLCAENTKSLGDLERKKVILLDMPNYIICFATNSSIYVNSNKASKWASQIKIDNSNIHTDLSKEEYLKDIRNFEYAEFEPGFSKTRERVEKFLFDILDLQDKFAYKENGEK